MSTVVAIICARGGSKGFPRKNLARLGGRPLIAWTIEAARGATHVDRVVVSTDDEEIAVAARGHGADVPFQRPAELATDATPGTASLLHAVQWLEQHQAYAPELVAYLQPTSPFRTSDDIDAAIDQLHAMKADAIVSVSPAEKHPYWMKRVDEQGWMHDFIQVQEPIERRQDLPPVYVLNGALYIVRRDVLLDTGSFYTERTAAYVMPPERSIDIDTAADFQRAAALVQS